MKLLFKMEIKAHLKKKMQSINTYCFKRVSGRKNWELSAISGKTENKIKMLLLMKLRF